MSDPKSCPPEEARACPFCGYQPEIEPWHGGGPDKHHVGCAGEFCDVWPGVTGETYQEALDKWNHREPAVHPLKEVPSE